MCTHMKRVQIGARYVKQTNQTKQKSELEFLGKFLHTLTEACVRRPNLTYTGFVLCTHAMGMCAQGYSKTLTQKRKP